MKAYKNMHHFGKIKKKKETQKNLKLTTKLVRMKIQIWTLVAIAVVIMKKTMKLIN